LEKKINKKNKKKMSHDECYKEFDRIKLHARLVKYGIINASTTLDEYEQNTGEKPSIEKINLDNEILALQCFALYTIVIATDGEQNPYVQRDEDGNYSMDMRIIYNDYFNNYFKDYETHRCERGRCNFLVYEKNQQQLAHPFTGALLEGVSGDVYVCEDSGVYHVCREGVCTTKRIVAKGFDMCPISARPYQPADVVNWKDAQTMKFDYIDYGDEPDTENQQQQRGTRKASAEDSDNGHSEDELDFETRMRVKDAHRDYEAEEAYLREMMRKRPRNNGDVAFEEEHRQKRQCEYEKALRQVKTDKRKKLAVLHGRYGSYMLLAKSVCNSVLCKYSPRADAIKKLVEKEAIAMKALLNSLSTRPYDLIRAACKHAELFTSFLLAAHPSVFAPEFTSHDVDMYATLLIKVWDRIQQTPYALDNRKRIIPENLFASIIYTIKIGIELTIVVDTRTRAIIPGITEYSMDSSTMSAIQLTLLAPDRRLNVIADFSVIRKHHKNIMMGMDIIKNCFNSLVHASATMMSIKNFVIT
jgi:hypothetical protein